MNNKGTVQLGDTICIVRPGKYSNNCIGLNATVTENLENGGVRAEMIYYNSAFGIEKDIVLAPGSFEPVSLRLYGVTVCRTGYVPGIQADSEDQAMKICNMFITDEDVCWSEDWPASDADLEASNSGGVKHDV